MNRWTDETEELVALAIHVADCEDSWEECRSGKAHRRAVHEVLAKLADAGLLTPPDSETWEEWVAEVDRGNGYRLSPHPVTPYVAIHEADIDQYLRGIIKPKRKLRRTVHTGPWVEVEPDGSPS